MKAIQTILMKQLTDIISSTGSLQFNSSIVFHYLWSLPSDFSDAVSSVEERLVHGGEDRVFKQTCVLLALFPEGWKLLPFIRLYRREHTAAWNDTHTAEAFCALFNALFIHKYMFCENIIFFLLKVLYCCTTVAQPRRKKSHLKITWAQLYIVKENG